VLHEYRKQASISTDSRSCSFLDAPLDVMRRYLILRVNRQHPTRSSEHVARTRETSVFDNESSPRKSIQRNAKRDIDCESPANAIMRTNLHTETIAPLLDLATPNVRYAGFARKKTWKRKTIATRQCTRQHFNVRFYMKGMMLL